MTDLEFTVVDDIKWAMNDLEITLKYTPIDMPDSFFESYRKLLIVWTESYHFGLKRTTSDDYSKFLDKVKESSTEVRHYLQRKLNHHVI